jgi:hypothetical protein
LSRTWNEEGGEGAGVGGVAAAGRFVSSLERGNGGGGVLFGRFGPAVQEGDLFGGVDFGEGQGNFTREAVLVGKLDDERGAVEADRGYGARLAHVRQRDGLSLLFQNGGAHGFFGGGELGEKGGGGLGFRRADLLAFGLRGVEVALSDKIPDGCGKGVDARRIS